MRTASSLLLAAAAVVLLAPGAWAQHADHRPGALLEAVVRALDRQWPDAEARDDIVESAQRYAIDARETRDLAEERAVVRAFLAELGASHLALYSRTTFDRLLAAIVGREVPGVGFQLVRRRDDYLVDAVLDGGPAARAGLRRGDVVIALDGVGPSKSPRFDWRSDDAALDDPARHGVLVEVGEVVEVTFRRDGLDDTVAVTATVSSVGDASRASARVVERAGARIGVVHFWLIQDRGCASLLRDLFDDDGAFAGVDALVLDLRGRGGSVAEVGRILRVLRRLRDAGGLRVVATIDRGTRSAKEVIAWELRDEGLATLVGEHTAGAVLPGTFVEVGHGAVLMMPVSMSLEMTEEQLEGIGVAPDVEVPDAWDGDPILERALDCALDRAARRGG